MSYWVDQVDLFQLQHFGGLEVWRIDSMLRFLTLRKKQNANWFLLEFLCLACGISLYLFFNLWMIITFCVLILLHSHFCNVPHISLFSVNNFKALFLCLCSFVSFVGKMTFQVSTTITITDPMPCRTVTLQVLHVPFVCVGVLFLTFFRGFGVIGINSKGNFFQVGEFKWYRNQVIQISRDLYRSSIVGGQE